MGVRGLLHTHTLSCTHHTHTPITLLLHVEVHDARELLLPYLEAVDAGIVLDILERSEQPIQAEGEGVEDRFEFLDGGLWGSLGLF